MMSVVSKWQKLFWSTSEPFPSSLFESTSPSILVNALWLRKQWNCSFANPNILSFLVSSKSKNNIHNQLKSEASKHTNKYLIYNIVVFTSEEVSKFKVHVKLWFEKCNREFNAQCKVLFFKKCNSFS